MFNTTSWHVDLKHIPNEPWTNMTNHGFVTLKGSECQPLQLSIFVQWRIVADSCKLQYRSQVEAEKLTYSISNMYKKLSCYRI